MEEQPFDSSEASARIAELQSRLEEAEETLRAIRSGEIDALVVSGPDGPQVYSLKGVETVYRVLVEAMNEGALVLTSDGIIMYSNSTFAEMLGVPLEQVTSAPIQRFVHESNLSAIDELLTEAKQGDTRREIALKKGEDGSVVPAQVSVGNLPADVTEGMSAVVTDLTEHKCLEAELEKYRKHLEELVVERTRQLQHTTEELAAANEELMNTIDELHESEERFRIMADSTPLLIWVTDRSAAVQFANRAYLDFFGTTMESMRSEGWEPLVHPQDAPAYVEAFLTSLRDRKGFHARTRVRRHDGEWRWVESYGEPRLSSTGEFLGIAGSSVDITEQVDHERWREDVHKRDHRIADTLQSALIPAVNYESPCCEVAVRYEPALKEAEVGGDFYDVFAMDDDRIGILIGDVVGKGLGAAIRVAAARHSVRSYAYLDPRPSRVLGLANDALSRDATDASEMLTAFFAVLDTRTGTLTYASGGHEPPLICTAEGQVYELTARGRALGILEGYLYEEQARLMQPGDMLVMVTDGITEARCSARMFFGMKRLKDFLAAEAPRAAVDTIADGILQAAKEFAGGELRDDAALVILRLRKVAG